MERNSFLQRLVDAGNSVVLFCGDFCSMKPWRELGGREGDFFQGAKELESFVNLEMKV